MRLFKILTLKLFRDLGKNIKQFLSIIFIVAISVTLYVGLDANATSFANRVNEVYKIGNVADEWITISPLIYDIDQMNEDLTFIKKEARADKGGQVETRFYMPASLGSSSVTALLVDALPTINAPYGLDTIDYSDDDIFFVDKALIKRYEENNEVTFHLGDTLPLNIDASNLTQLLNLLVSDENTLKLLFEKIVSISGVSQEIQDVLLRLFPENAAETASFVINIVENLFTNSNIEFNIKVNGIMSHPENIDSGEFSSSNILVAKRLLAKEFVNYIGEHFETTLVIEAIDAYLSVSTNTALNEILTLLKDYLLNETVANRVNENIEKEIATLTSEIDNKSNTVFEYFLTNFYNQIVVKLREGDNLTSFNRDVNNYYDTKENNNLIAALTRSNYPSLLSVENDINQSRQLAYVFPIIFFVVALLIVLTTISSLVLKDRVQIGTFKALGVRREIIALYYLAEMNIVTLLGLVIGLIIGPLLIPFIMNIKYDILYSLPSLSYYFPFLTAFAVFLILFVLVSALTLILLFSELKLSPSQSMRTKAPKIGRLKAHKHLIKNTSYMMAIRNIKVHIAKSLMVIIGVMGCTGLLICGMGIDDTINYGKDLDLTSFYSADINVTLNGAIERGNAKEELLKFDGVEEVEEYSTLNSTLIFEDRSVSSTIYGISKNSDFFKYDDNLDHGNWEEKGIALTKAKAEDLGVSVGDYVSFDINGKIYEREVVYIFYAFFVNGAYIYIESDPTLFATSSALWVNANDGENLNAIKENILLNYKSAYSVLTRDDMTNRINGYMSSIATMTNTVKVFAILLAVVVLINLSILNFNERLRELATLKVLGFSRSKIVASLLIEMLILTLIGAFLGLFIGLPLEYLVLSVNETNLVSWLYLVKPLTYVISFFLSLLTAIIVNLFMYFKVNSISMSESLKSVEE